MALYDLILHVRRSGFAERLGCLGVYVIVDACGEIGVEQSALQL